MDWVQFIISNCLFVLDGVLKNPRTKAKYKSRFKQVYKLIGQVYPEFLED